MVPTSTGRHLQGLEGRKGMPRAFLEMLHPKLVDKPPTGDGWLHEIKFDGYRVQAHIEASRVTLYTRNGNLWTDVLPPLPYLISQLSEIEDCVLEGELMAEGEGGYSSFSKLRSAIFKDPDSLVLQVFDVLWHCAEDMRPYSLKNRKTVLRQILAAAPDVSDVIRYVQPVPGQGKALLDAACGLRWEGIVSKKLSEPYKAGRREAWVKSKCRPSESIVVVGYQTDNGRFAYLLGAVRQKDGRLKYAGAIKGGYGADVALDVLRAIKPLETKDAPPFTAPVKKTKDMHWLRPELIAEVEMAEFTGSGMMRQSSFKGFRDDLGRGPNFR